MSPSVATVHEVPRPLREGQIVRGDDNPWRENWFVGGQSPLSYQRAWQLLESLLDSFEHWRPGSCLGTPHPCASARFGNCVALHIERRCQR